MTTTTSMIQQPLSRTVRSGISLSIDGTISVEVDVFAAVADDRLGLNGFCASEHAPAKVKQTLACPICGNSDQATHQRGKEVDGGIVVVPPEVLEAAKGKAEEFHGEINLSVHKAVDVAEAMPSGKTYYLKVAKKHPAALTRYVALASVLESRTDLALVGVGSLKGALSRFVLMSSGGTLMLRQLADPALVRQRPVVTGDAPVDVAAAAKIESIIDMLVTDFDPLERTNYSEQVVQEFIDAAQPVPAAELPTQDRPSEPGIDASLDNWVAELQARTGKALVAVPDAEPKKRAPRKAAATKPTTKKKVS